MSNLEININLYNSLVSEVFVKTWRCSDWNLVRRLFSDMKVELSPLLYIYLHWERIYHVIVRWPILSSALVTFDCKQPWAERERNCVWKRNSRIYHLQKQVWHYKKYRISTVHTFLKHQGTTEDVENKPRSGWPKKWSPQDEWQIFWMVKINRRQNLTDQWPTTCLCMEKSRRGMGPILYCTTGWATFGFNDLGMHYIQWSRHTLCCRWEH